MLPTGKGISMRLLCSLAVLLLAVPASAVTVDWVRVGDPDNSDDTTGYGSVDYAYRISKHEVTNAQYAEFLNAKASSDPLDLYHANMAGISRLGSSGSYSYSVGAGFESKAVGLVTFFDALRFANWMHNGQGEGGTESGAYTLLGGAPTPTNFETVERNSGARIALTSEDEWYKAAYFDSLAMNYFDYPASSDMLMTCSGPTSATNHANCMGSGVTDVGSYPGSVSPYGTLDQGGNVYEWTESNLNPASANRILRGGSYFNLDPSELGASSRITIGSYATSDFIGFRIVEVPEPSTPLLVCTGLIALTVRRRRRG